MKQIELPACCLCRKVMRIRKYTMGPCFRAECDGGYHIVGGPYRSTPGHAVRAYNCMVAKQRKANDEL